MRFLQCFQRGAVLQLDSSSPHETLQIGNAWTSSSDQGIPVLHIAAQTNGGRAIRSNLSVSKGKLPNDPVPRRPHVVCQLLPLWKGRHRETEANLGNEAPGRKPYGTHDLSPAATTKLDIVLDLDRGISSGSLSFRLQAVSANNFEASSSGPPSLTDVEQALGRLARADAVLMDTLTSVACSVAGPGAEHQGCVSFSRCLTSSSGMGVSVYGSYLRDLECGTLSPALIVEVEDGAWLQPVPLRGEGTADEGLTCTADNVLQKQQQEQQLQQKKQPQKQQKQRQQKQPQKQPQLAVWADSSSTSQHQGRPLSGKAEDENSKCCQGRSRSSAVLESVPWIATLMELPEVPDQGEEGTTGRVLLQNKLSRDYWGHKDVEQETGSWDLVTALFEAHPDALPDLQRWIAEINQVQPEVATWKKVVMVRRKVGSTSSSSAGHTPGREQAFASTPTTQGQGLAPLPEQPCLGFSAGVSDDHASGGKQRMSLLPWGDSTCVGAAGDAVKQPEVRRKLSMCGCRSLSGHLKAGGLCVDKRPRQRRASEGDAARQPVEEARSMEARGRRLPARRPTAPLPMAMDVREFDSMGCCFTPSKHVRNLLAISASPDQLFGSRTSMRRLRRPVSSPGLYPLASPVPHTAQPLHSGNNPLHEAPSWTYRTAVLARLSNTYASASNVLTKGSKEADLGAGGGGRSVGITSSLEARCGSSGMNAFVRCSRGQARPPESYSLPESDALPCITLHGWTDGQAVPHPQGGSRREGLAFEDVMPELELEVSLAEGLDPQWVQEETVEWHEVEATLVDDPITGRKAILLMQSDITARAQVEQRMSVLTETQLTMLENMFPRHVLDFMLGSMSLHTDLAELAREHRDVTIMFMDIVGFTSMSKSCEAHMVMDYLNSLFRKIDRLSDHHSVFKVETAGDCYIVAGGLMTTDEGIATLDAQASHTQGAKSVIEFAQAVLRHAGTVQMPHDGRPTCIRIGIHTGSVVSGLIGTKLPKFSLFGDTMNTSSRMESTSKPGCIQISESTYALLEEEHRDLFVPTGGVQVKGKGLMSSFTFTPSSDQLQLRSHDLEVLNAPDSGSFSPMRRMGSGVIGERASPLSRAGRTLGALIPGPYHSSPAVPERTSRLGNQMQVTPVDGQLPRGGSIPEETWRDLRSSKDCARSKNPALRACAVGTPAPGQRQVHEDRQRCAEVRSNRPTGRRNSILLMQQMLHLMHDRKSESHANARVL